MVFCKSMKRTVDKIEAILVVSAEVVEQAVRLSNRVIDMV
jgi:hypothetical protein